MNVRGMGGDMIRVLDELNSQSVVERKKDDELYAKEPHVGDVKAGDPRMFAISEDSALFLNILIRSAKFLDVLEVGMSVGYSTIWFAEAVASRGGSVTAIERTAAKIERAKKNFVAAGISNVSIVGGEALDILRSLDRKFDFILIDADKEAVREYFDLSLGALRTGGIIAVDNMTYPERYRNIMAELANYIRTLPNVRTVTVPIGNGIEVSTKIS